MDLAQACCPAAGTDQKEAAEGGAKEKGEQDKVRRIKTCYKDYGIEEALFFF